MAAAHLALADRLAATRDVDRALEIAREDGQRLNEARALRVAAAIRDSYGETAKAAELTSAALEIFTDLGVPDS
jgi:hypothetical protein